MAEGEDSYHYGVPLLNKDAMIPTIKAFYPENDQHPSSQRVSSDVFEPQDATTETLDKLSVLQLNMPQGTILLKPKVSEIYDMALIDTFSKDLNEAKKAGEALQECVEERGGIHHQGDICLEDGKEVCHEECIVYKEKCEKLTKDIELLSQIYTKQTEYVEEQTLKLRQRDEEVKNLEEMVDMQAEVQHLLEQGMKIEHSKVSELESLKKYYEKDSKKLEEMRVKLATKEKSNSELCSKIKKLEKDVAELKDDNENYIIIIDTNKHTKEQLKRCQQIRGMLSSLPNASREEMDRLTQQISTETTKMKACSTNKRSTSWRQ